MSKTFKCVEHEEEVLEVYPFTGEEGGRKFSLLMPHVSSHAGIAFDSTTAPALALAILEAAGVVHHDPDDTPYEKSERTENMGALNMSAFYLAKHVNDAEKAEFLAKEQAKLEAEALDMCNKYITELGYDPVDSWDGSFPEKKSAWLAVARRAREINKETPNA